MEVTLHSTSKVVELEFLSEGSSGRKFRVPARIWEGHTAAGVPVIAMVTRISPERDQDLAEFERDLREVAAPSKAAESWPLRMVL